MPRPAIIQSMPRPASSCLVTPLNIKFIAHFLVKLSTCYLDQDIFIPNPSFEIPPGVSAYLVSGQAFVLTLQFRDFKIHLLCLTYHTIISVISKYLEPL